jgi:hypothetical protein
MAPELVSNWAKKHLPRKSVVLDPMCGSGVVLRQAASLGHVARGFDVDPLAVLMSKVWTAKISSARLLQEAERVANSALRRTVGWDAHPTFAECEETKAFVRYWFAVRQRTQLTRLCRALDERRHEMPVAVFNALQLCISKTIITKQAGASLAWDVSHSRPHKVATKNEFDVISGFRKSATRLAEVLSSESIAGSALVERADCRQLESVQRSSVDAVITSPPYLNALDYLRGHKLALVWFGFSIPELRDIRSGSIGTERATLVGENSVSIEALRKAVPKIDQLPQRQRSIVVKYAEDASLFLTEMQRVLKPRGHLVLVLADSVVRQVEVSSSKIFAEIAKRKGFKRYDNKLREIPQNRRYMPIGAPGTATGGRMRTESVQAFSLG